MDSFQGSSRIQSRYVLATVYSEEDGCIFESLSSSLSASFLASSGSSLALSFSLSSSISFDSSSDSPSSFFMAFSCSLKKYSL